MQRRYYGGISAYGWRDYLSTQRLGRGGAEIRRPKPENRRKSEGRNPKSEYAFPQGGSPRGSLGWRSQPLWDWGGAGGAEIRKPKTEIRRRVSQGGSLNPKGIAPSSPAIRELPWVNRAPRAPNPKGVATTAPPPRPLRASFGLRSSGLGFGMARTDFRAALPEGASAICNLQFPILNLQSAVSITTKSRQSQPERQVKSSLPCFCTTSASRRMRPRRSVWRSFLLSA